MEPMTMKDGRRISAPHLSQTRSATATLMDEPTVDERHDELVEQTVTSNTWKEAVMHELHHIVLITAIGVLGIALPDYLFSEKTSLPAHLRVPGQVVSFNGTAMIGGVQSSLSYETFVKNAMFNQKHIGEASVKCNATCLTIWAGPMIFVYTLGFYAIMHWGTRTPYPRYLSDFLSFTYSYLVGMALVFWVSKFIKYQVGYPRPDFFGRCGELTWNDDFSNVKCHPPDHDDYIKGWESFISGHAAYMFTASTVSICWMFGKLHYMSKKLKKFEHFEIVFKGGKVERALNFMWLLKMLASWQWLFSMYISLTRLMDNRHHPADTVGGIFLGFLCGFTGFKSQFGMNYAHSWRLLEESNWNTYNRRFGERAMQSAMVSVGKIRTTKEKQSEAAAEELQQAVGAPLQAVDIESDNDIQTEKLQ